MLLEKMAVGHRARRELAIAATLDAAAAQLHEQVETMRGVLQRGPGAELETASGAAPGEQEPGRLSTNRPVDVRPGEQPGRSS